MAAADTGTVAGAVAAALIVADDLPGPVPDNSTSRATDPCAKCFSFVVFKCSTGAGSILCAERRADASIAPLVDDTVASRAADIGADTRAAPCANGRADPFADVPAGANAVTNADGSQL